MPRIFKLVSLAVHATAIAVVFLAQIFDVGPLPVPRQALAYDTGRLVKIADIPLPPPTRRPAANDAPTVSQNAAPTEPPRGIIPETGLESAAADRSSSNAIASVENGGNTGLPFGTMDGSALPPPPPAPQQPIPLHKGIQPPRKIVDVAPIYPPLARSARQQGTVILETVIDARGAVETVRVLRGYPLLDQAAIAAVSQWRFTPALLNGQPVPVVMTVTVTFVLQ